MGNSAKEPHAMKPHYFFRVAVGVLTVVLFPSILSCQVQVGLRGGINLSTFSVSGRDGHWEEAALSSYVGPIVGATMEVGFSDIFFTRVEALYVQKGTNYSFPTLYGGRGTEDRPLKVDLFELPILLGGQVRSGAWRLFAFTGPSIGFLLTDGYNTTDFAVDAGIGASVEVSPVVSFSADVRYSLGLSNLNSADQGAAGLYTRGIQPMVALMFRL